MLMTLLPLAGWAWSLTAPTTQPLYWTGEEQSLLQTLPGLPAAYDLDYATGGVVYLVTTSATEPDNEAKAGATNVVPKATHVGLYYVWYAAKSDGGAYNTESEWACVPVRINKGNPVVTAPVGKDALTYDGLEQSLIETAASATLGATVVYSFEETGVYYASLDLIKQTNANETGYNVYYKVVGNENYNDVAPQSINVKIMKATATLTAPVLYGQNEDALTYNGGAQAIIKTAASATGTGLGTIKYKVGEGDTWYDAIEADGLKQTNAGTYNVYYKMEAGTNYNAVDPAYVTAQAIVAKNIEGVTISIPKQTFTGSALTPDFTVKDGTADLVKDTDYEYTDTDWANNTNAGDNSASVTVHGKGNYTGTVVKTFSINQKSLEGSGINYDNVATAITADPKTYNGSAQEFANMATVGTAADEVVITYGTYNLVKGTDYTISYANNTDAGDNTASITFAGTGNFRLAKTINFSIAAKPVTIDAKVEPATVGYGAEYTPGVDWTSDGVTDADKTALGAIAYTYKKNNNGAEGADVANPSEVGKYFVYADFTTPNTNYSVTATKGEFEITAGQVIASISATATYGSLPTFTLTHVSGLSTAEAATFNATNNLSKVTIKKDGAVVNELENVAKDNANLATLDAGEYDLEATASCGDSYTVIVSAGKLTVNPNAAYVFTIADIAAVDYKAAKWEPEVAVTGLTAGTDYTVSYGDDTHDNINAGTGIVKIAGAGNYAGATGSKTFTINKADLIITADNFTGEKAWTYGTVEPTYTATVTGYLDGESFGGTLAGIEGTLKVKRTSNETVGMHTGALVAGFYNAEDNKIATPVATNYDLTFNPGDLQVAKGAVVIQLKEAVTATYGDDPATSINAAIKNIANYEYVSGLSELEAANFASIIDVAAATFELTETKPQVGTNYNFAINGATSTNYGVTINPGTYNVTAADITLYANDQAINWSDTDPDNDAADTEVKAATVTIAAGELKYTDALADVVASIVIASQNVGTNNISLTAAENANYNIVVNSDGTNAKYGVLTVTAAPALALSTADADLVAKLTSYAGKSMPVTIDFTARNGRTLGETRNWEANYWNTLVLPFDITVADLSKALGYAIVNVIDPTRTEVSGTGSKFYGKLTMKGGNGNDTKLAANKPFMVKTADAITGIVDFGTQTIVAPDNLSVEAGGGANFTGTYTTKTVTGADNAAIWFLMGNYTNWAFIKSTSTANWDILPFEAFINMSSSSASSFTFYFEELDGSVTAIKSVDAEDAESAESAAEGWYTINGIKLNAKPTQKGIYIFNGKKVAIQ